MELDKFAINLDRQSTLAKLLAQENINVIHGNYDTAWFDPKRRVLALPIWKNRGKSVYDLLTGHEVGHALFTPALGWHDAVTDIKGAPKAYLNVLEDVRIERKIKNKFPGLTLQFQRGYKVLFDEDFFGVKNTDISTLILIDRINLKSKVGEHLSVPFSSKEQALLEEAYRTETFDDVVDLAKRIYAIQKELAKGTKPSQKQVSFYDVQPEDLVSDNSNDYHKPDDEESLSEDQQESTPDDTPSDSGSNSDSQEDSDSDNVVNVASNESDDSDIEALLESITDNAFRKSEESLIASDEIGKRIVLSINKVRQQDIIVDYKVYYNTWQNQLKTIMFDESELLAEFLVNGYAKFKTENELAASHMAKEFEIRKAAFQYSRASTHKTGLLNTNKLHAYKTTDDIFLKSTKLANYQNHGMMMFIDFSGSMQNTIGATIRQLLSLTLFCKMANIPFEVYAFTSETLDDYNPYNDNSYSDSEIIINKFNLLNLMSSRMTRKEYMSAQKQLWFLSNSWDGKLTRKYITHINRLHSTPLNSCIFYANQLVSKFKASNKIEKMTTIFLTDGESDKFVVNFDVDAYEHRKIDTVYRNNPCIVRANGKIFEVPSYDDDKMTIELLKNFKQTTDCNVLGFFISQYRGQTIKRVTNISRKHASKAEHYSNMLTKNRALVEDNILGYDRYFGLCVGSIDVQENDFDRLLDEDATTNQIRSAFSKVSKQKRVNRIFLNAFVDAIA
jgi:hypothetical protein